ncbi:S9 family peptidase [Nocardioides yefusunii]|uniref:S9 family peptidase n=1 Tax=Nocardioides yefusunii TaxID=2500546 RepID=A0ABW1QXA0_9ACTN|nr:S9 family peptidase [Nocardioides yefusunii]
MELEVQPPVAERRPVTRELHGLTRVDDYEWLREKENPEVLAHLEAENAFTEARTAHLADLRATLFDEVKNRVQETDLSVPTRSRGWWFYSRTFEGKEYGASCRVPVTDPEDWTPPTPDAAAHPDQPALPGEQVLLDLNELAEGHDFFSLGGSALSLDDRYLAWSVDTEGDERYTIRVKELATGTVLDDVVEGVLGGATWHPDGTSFYYNTVDDAWRADKIWRHRLGTPQSEDELVFHESDQLFWTGLGRSRDNRFLFIVSGSKTTSEWSYLDTTDPDATWTLFHPRTTGLEYGLEPAVIGGESVFLVMHNATGANFELASAPVAPTGPDGWTPVIAHDESVRLEEVDAFATHLVVQQRAEGLTQLAIVELTDDGLGETYPIAFDREVYTVGASGNPDFHQPTVRLGWTSMAVPSSVYDYDVRTRELTLLRRTPVLGGFDPDLYEEHRIWVTARDGEQVPVSLVCRTDVRAEGRPMPTLLYGYGSYESSVDPYFSVPRLSLMDRGAAFAIAHVRGGGEMGRRWYEQGKLNHKTNTFNDFVDVARHLVTEGWTTAETLVAEGGSAGGLLMGAVVNQAPELFAGIVADVPFVDALTTMLDSTLPLTIGEYEEWGNPEAEAEVYALMASYAPYDNVAAVDYPPILAETSLNDTRVLYVEPAKWIAKLRATAVGRRDFLLRIEMAAGHGGVSGRYKAWHDRAFSTAWILDRMGLAQVPPRSAQD